MQDIVGRAWATLHRMVNVIEILKSDQKWQQNVESVFKLDKMKIILAFWMSYTNPGWPNDEGVLNHPTHLYSWLRALA